MKFFTRTNIPASKRLITKSLWKSLILELRARGNKRNESGAFLLGPPEQNEITGFICYDELDPHCYETKIIRFSGNSYRPLWEYCRQHNLTVLADVHTHPFKGTIQSGLDREHPMIVERGHLALIVPYFAQRNIRSFNGIGFYEYLGDFQWKTFSNTKEALAFL
jgi:proteasome lid subunit RPN8/RPN11